MKKFTEEHKRKLSKARIKGIQEGRIKIWNKGIPINEETRRKDSEAKKRNPTKYWLGKHCPHRLKLNLENNPMKNPINVEKMKRTKTIRNKWGLNKGKKFPKEKYPLLGLRGTRNKIIMPIQDTSIEQKIQSFLKQLQIEFFTHQYVNMEHGYQCDIFIPSKNLIIECFGNYWHKYPVGREIDNLRCQELRQKGYKVFVFWGNEIKVMELNDFRRKIQNEK